MPAPGAWPGGKPSLFCLGDGVGAPVPVIAFPSLLNYCTDRINVKNSSILLFERVVT